MRHHPDDVKAVRAANLPRLMAIAQAVRKHADQMPRPVGHKPRG